MLVVVHQDHRIADLAEKRVVVVRVHGGKRHEKPAAAGVKPGRQLAGERAKVGLSRRGHVFEVDDEARGAMLERIAVEIRDQGPARFGAAEDAAELHAPPGRTFEVVDERGQGDSFSVLAEPSGEIGIMGHAHVPVGRDRVQESGRQHIEILMMLLE